MKNITKLVSLLVLSAAAANAAIIVMDTATYASAGNETISSFNLNFAGFDPSSADKLVVTVSGRGATAGSTSVSSMSFNSTALSAAIQQQNERIVTAVYYVDSALANGALEINFSQNVYAIGVSVLALSGTDTGVGPTVGVNNLSGTLTTTTDGSLAIAAAHYFRAASDGTTVTPNSPMTSLLATPLYFAGAGAGYYEVPTAGDFNYSFTASGGSLATTAAVAFAPIPEPSTALLGGLGLLALLRRRR